MDSFDTCTWADFVVETTFLGTYTGLLPKAIALVLNRTCYTISVSPFFLFAANSQEPGNGGVTLDEALLNFSIATTF
jgi:hypothetical protein